MSKRIRQIICEKISQITSLQNVYHELEVPAKKQQKFALHWTLTGKENNFNELLQPINGLQFEKNVVQSVRILPGAGKHGVKVEFELEPQAFVADTLLHNAEDQLTTTTMSGFKRQHVLFEFSSPNIAKPFHVGHLRSTIIGNVLANLHQHLGYKVTKINYLGDWGTQFGMLQVGVEMMNVTDEQMRAQPIETLYRAYVAANTAAKTDASISAKARRYFSQLETGMTAEMSRQWQQYRQYTIAELEQVYARLGVHFDAYEWESQYSQTQIVGVLERLKQKSLLLDEHDGRKVVQVDERRVPIIKSDGSTLYLARDIAALVERFQRYQFERIFYVVDNAQTDHFNALFKTTAALCSGDEDLKLECMQHIKFGRIHGMSTRSGNVVFLRDVLDEARDIMLEKQLKSATTKVELLSDSSDYKSTADILGVSAVIVNDLKQRRQRDYNFDWHKVLQVNGDTGVKLQYTHCRLHSLLEEVAADVEITDINPDAFYLQEREAQDLLFEIARFEQSLWLAKVQLEACVLVNYLFALCNSTSRALKRLNVKNEPCRSTRHQRLLLFHVAKCTLNKGMEILSLKPLKKM